MAILDAVKGFFKTKVGIALLVAILAAGGAFSDAMGWTQIGDFFEGLSVKVEAPVSPLVE